MDFIYSKIEAFVLQLPPLLQLILGAAVLVLVLRTMVAIGDFFENKREKKED
jgi:hypothetical protein